MIELFNPSILECFERTKHFYPANFAWIDNGRIITKEVFYLRRCEGDETIIINSINQDETEKIIENSEDINGSSYHLKSLIEGDLNKTGFNIKLELNTATLLKYLKQYNYEDNYEEQKKIYLKRFEK